MNVEKMSVFLKRVHFVRLVLFLILLNAVVLALLVLPNKAKIEKLQASYADLRTQAAKEESGKRNLQERLHKLQDAQKDLETIYKEKLVTKEKGVPDIRLELESLTQSLQVRKRDFSYSYKPLPDFGLQEFTLGVPVEGNYRNIRRLINSIERSRHFLILDRVDLSSERKGDLLTLDFRLTTYLVDHEI